MKKIVASLFLVVLIIAVTACSNSKNIDGDTKTVSNGSSSNDAKSSLAIKDSGWSFYQSDFGNEFSYGFELYNKDKNYLAGFPKVKIVGRDDNNKILFSYDATLDYIYPGETLYYGDTTSIETERPAKVEFTVSVAKSDWENSKTVSYPKNTDFPISNISEFKDDSDLKYTGEIENKSNTDIHAAAIVVIFKKDNKIVGGANSFSDKLDSKQKDAFEMYVLNPPEYDSYEFSSHVSMIN